MTPRLETGCVRGAWSLRRCRGTGAINWILLLCMLVRYSHLVISFLFVSNYIFVFLHAHFSYCFRLLFTHGDLYSVRFFRIILLNIGVSDCIRLTSILSLRSSFSCSVLRARKSRNVCKCLSFVRLYFLCCFAFSYSFCFVITCNNLFLLTTTIKRNVNKF